MSNHIAFSSALRRFRARPAVADPAYVDGLVVGATRLGVCLPFSASGDVVERATVAATVAAPAPLSGAAVAAAVAAGVRSAAMLQQSAAALAPHPGSNTGGKSSDASSSQCLIDTLTVSFSGLLFDNHYLRSFVVWLDRVSGGMLSVGGVLDRKMNGYSECYFLCLASGGESPNLGWLGVSRGDDSMRGRWCLHLTGVGCGLFRDWSALAAELPGYEGRITRIDLAVDDLEGRHPISEIRSLYEAGAFNMRGRSPKFSEVRSTDGNTFYVGKRGSGKFLRVYEKGKKLGDSLSPWVRHEVELRGTGRVIPFEVFSDPLAFFKGCYTSVYDWVSEGAASLIRTIRRSAEVSVQQAMLWGRRAVGRLVCYLREVEKRDDSQIVDDLLMDRAGRRLSGRYPFRLFVADPLELALESAWHRPCSTASPDCPF